MVFFSRNQSILLRALIVLTATSGFAYQTWTISNDYFKYPTSTLVTLQKYLKVTIGPQVGFHVVNLIPIGKAVKEMFNTTFVQSSYINTTGYVRTRTWARWMNDTAFKTKAFQQMEDYYVTIAPSKEIRYSPEIMYLKRQPIYQVQLNTTFLNRQMSVFVHPYHSDFEGLHKTDSKVECNAFNKETCEVSLTYSTKITKLAPPPYDTGCQSYEDNGYTSKENCISKCLSEFTTKHGFVIASNVLDREMYENSSLLLFIWHLRTMQTRAGLPVTLDLLRGQHRQYSKKGDVPYTEMFTKIMEIYYSYKNHWKGCMDHCRRSDCITEVHLSVIQSVTGTGEKAHYPREVNFYLFPPNDQVTIVTSQPKLILMDFIVYILSSVSFWFGFCPMQVIGKVERVSPRTRFPANIQKEEIEKVLSDLLRRLRKVEERKSVSKQNFH